MHEEDGPQFDLEFDWELSLETLVMVHFLNNRRWDIDGRLVFPSCEDIQIKARAMVEAIRDMGGGTYITLYGMKIYTDPEFPDSYEIYIKAGHASPRVPEGSK